MHQQKPEKSGWFSLFLLLCNFYTSDFYIFLASETSYEENF